MSRLLQPFVLVVTAVLGVGYAYVCGLRDDDRDQAGGGRLMYAALAGASR